MPRRGKKTPNYQRKKEKSFRKKRKSNIKRKNGLFNDFFLLPSYPEAINHITRKAEVDSNEIEAEAEPGAELRPPLHPSFPFHVLQKKMIGRLRQTCSNVRKIQIFFFSYIQMWVFLIVCILYH